MDDRDRDRDEHRIIDHDVVAFRKARREQELERTRRARRRAGIGAGAAAILVLVGAGAWAFGVPGLGDDDGQTATPGATADTGARPVRVEPAPDAGPLAPASEPGPTVTATGGVPIGTLPSPQGDAPPKTRTVTFSSDTRPRRSPPPAVPDPAPAAAAGTRPVVWVQAGHAPPGEPGYRAQTGAGSGPFGSEVAFTTRTADALVAALRAKGVDALRTNALVTPWGARGAVFISVHSDTPSGHSAIGHAVTGAGENYYEGEGTGTASPTPYANSAPHRKATTVSAAVEATSARLASRISRRWRPVFTAANGARTRFEQVPRTGNVRMMHFYGYYRTRADARVLIEAGAGDVDDAFLARTPLIARTLAAGIVDHLRAEGKLG